MKPPTLAEQDAERRVRNVENAGRYANPPVLDLSPILETIPADVLAAVEVPSAATVRAALDRAEAMRARPEAGAAFRALADKAGQPPFSMMAASAPPQLARLDADTRTRLSSVDAHAALKECRRELAEAHALLAEGVAVVEKAERERDAHRAAATDAMGLLQQVREAGKLPKWAKEKFKAMRDAWLNATKEST